MNEVVHKVQLTKGHIIHSIGYLIRILVVLCYSCLHVVGVNIVDSFYFISFNILPHNRVSVHKEPDKDITAY